MLNEPSRNVLLIVAAMTIQAPITFVYTDCDGVVSFRNARVLSVQKATKRHGPVVSCFDLDRQAPRSFRLTNIDSVEIPGVTDLG